jgi:hypothetical protein|tara:strand:+ start:9782 stop:9937 length:156 start_codon:yes stop_codon:yes gene_type:complete
MRAAQGNDGRILTVPAHELVGSPVKLNDIGVNQSQNILEIVVVNQCSSEAI